MEPFFLATVATGFLAEAVKGVIKKRVEKQVEDLFCRIVGVAVSRFFSRLSQRSKDALNWQNALHQAAIEATLDVVNECLRELPSSSLWERFPFARTFPDETRKWLEDVRRQLTDDLRHLREGATLTQISEEAQKRIEAILQPEGVLSSERASEFVENLTNLLLSNLRDRFGEPPEIFVQKVKGQPTWFERFRALFAKKLEQQPELNDFLQTQLLASVKSELEQLGEKVDEVLEIVRQWSHLLPDIDQRLQGIERLMEEVRKEVGIVRKGVEEILSLMRSQFGSEHLVISLRERTEKFIQDLSTRPFIGRKEPLQKLDKFINENSKGVAIVYAPAGYRKTTLLANWLKGVRQQPNVATAYHFFNRHPTLAPYATSLGNALAHLIGQVWAMTEANGSSLSLPEDVISRMAVLENMLANLSLAQGEKLILVLDGLDEAEPILEHPPIRDLPDGVFFVVSGRWDEKGELPPYLKGWARFTEFIPLHALTPDELKEWLRKWGDGELAKFADDDEFVNLLHQKTEGFPLYVHYLLDELGELARKGQNVHQALERKPVGLRKYVKEQIGQLESTVKEESVWKLFAFLTQAKGALRGSELKQLGISARDLRGLLRQHVVRRWLSVGEEDEEQTLAFAHPLLAEEFGKVLEEEEVEKARKELLNWCASWREHKSHYALRHFAHHLYDDPSRWEQLFDLARDEKFAQTQREVLPNEPELPLLTIQLALDAAIKSEKPETMTEMVLRHALRFETAETPLQAQRRGESERAIGLAKQWLERDYKQGTLWLLLLAWSWKREGKRELAKRCLDEISQWCRGKSSEALGWGDWRSKMASFLLGELVSELVEVEGWKEMSLQLLWDYDLSGLAVQLAQEGKFDEALQIAKEIREVPWERSWALREIAKVMAKEGLFEEAIKVAREIEEAAECSETLREIAEAMAKAGMIEHVEETFEEAMKVARKSEDVQDRLVVLRGIAEAMAKIGMKERAEEAFKEAMKVAKEIEEAGEHSEALNEIAITMAKAGKFGEAIKMASKIEDSEKRSWALREIARVMAEEGMMEHAKEALKEAIKAAKKIEGAWERSWELKEIAEILFEEATNVVKEIEEAFWRSEALRGIAEAMAKGGMVEHAKETLEEAVKVAREIEGEKNRSQALSRIAEAMVKTGIMERAKEVAEEAMKVAKEIGDEGLRSEMLTEIAAVMAKAGMFEEAMKVVKELGNEGWRSEALIEIAVVVAKEGMIERAKETFEEAMKTRMTKEIGDAEWHSKALTEIAIAMAKVGKFEEAMKIAKEVEDARERSRALRWLAEKMVKEGAMERAERAKKAMKVAKEIEDAEERSWVMSEIATEMTKVGKFEEAMEVARKIENVRLRLWALKEIAAEMAKAGKIEEAMKVAGEIEDAGKRSKVLNKIAGEMARA